MYTLKICFLFCLISYDTDCCLLIKKNVKQNGAIEKVRVYTKTGC